MSIQSDHEHQFNDGGEDDDRNHLETYKIPAMPEYAPGDDPTARRRAAIAIESAQHDNPFSRLSTRGKAMFAGAVATALLTALGGGVVLANSSSQEKDIPRALPTTSAPLVPGVGETTVPPSPVETTTQYSSIEKAPATTLESPQYLDLSPAEQAKATELHNMDITTFYSDAVTPEDRVAYAGLVIDSYKAYGVEQLAKGTANMQNKFTPDAANIGMNAQGESIMTDLNEKVGILHWMLTDNGNPTLIIANRRADAEKGLAAVFMYGPNEYNGETQSYMAGFINDLATTTSLLPENDGYNNKSVTAQSALISGTTSLPTKIIEGAGDISGMELRLSYQSTAEMSGKVQGKWRIFSESSVTESAKDLQGYPAYNG